MSDAWVGLIGVALGLLAAPFVEWIRWRATRAERVATQHIDFQREHLIGAQLALIEMSWAQGEYSLLVNFRDPPATEAERIAAQNRLITAEGQVIFHNALIEDEQTRELIEKTRNILREQPDQKTRKAYAANRDEAAETLFAANARIGEVARALWR